MADGAHQHPLQGRVRGARGSAVHDAVVGAGAGMAESVQERPDRRQRGNDHQFLRHTVARLGELWLLSHRHLSGATLLRLWLSADFGRPGNRRFGAGGGGRHRRHEPAPTAVADYVSVAAARVGLRRGAHFHPHPGHLRDAGPAGAAGPVLYLFDPDLRLAERAQQRRRLCSRPGPDRHGDHLHLDQQPGDRHSEELRDPHRQGLPAARNQHSGPGNGRPPSGSPPSSP